MSEEYGQDFLPNLIMCGAVLDDAAFTDSNLDIDIHPILRRENWQRKDAEKNWDNIMLALQLVSHFLTERKCLEFWAKLIHGKIARTIHRRKYVIKDVDFTDEVMEETKLVLANMAKWLHYSRLQ